MPTAQDTNEAPRHRWPDIAYPRQMGRQSSAGLPGSRCVAGADGARLEELDPARGGDFSRGWPRAPTPARPPSRLDRFCHPCEAMRQTPIASPLTASLPLLVRSKDGPAINFIASMAARHRSRAVRTPLGGAAGASGLLRPRRPVAAQLAAEKSFAAEELKIGVLDLAGAELPHRTDCTCA